MHNGLNLLATAAVARALGIGPEALAEGVRLFEGVLRRQQLLFDTNGITVIEDFAHHPTEVKATLDGLRESYPNKRILAVFEPRSNTSRRAFFQEAYGKCFASADVAVLLEIADAGGYSATEGEIVALDVKKVLEDIKKDGVTPHYQQSVSEIQQFLLREARDGDLIVLMSNGSFGGLPASLVSALKEL